MTETPAVTDTFHRPCHTCGQAVEVVGGQEQPHTCRTYDTDVERICAAYWAGFERAAKRTEKERGILARFGWWL